MIEEERKYTGRFIVRDKEDSHKFCEFFISEGKDLAILQNNGMEILSINAICQESINADSQEGAIIGYSCDKSATYAPEEADE